MKKLIFPLGIVLLLFLGCEKEDKKPPYLGTWRTIEFSLNNGNRHHYNYEDGVMVEWGNWYVLDFELLEDGTLDLKTNNIGQWEFDIATDNLLIYDQKDGNIIHKFSLSIDSSKYLILKDHNQLLKHRKL